MLHKILFFYPKSFPMVSYYSLYSCYFLYNGEECLVMRSSLSPENSKFLYGVYREDCHPYFFIKTYRLISLWERYLCVLTLCSGLFFLSFLKHIKFKHTRIKLTMKSEKDRQTPFLGVLTIFSVCHECWCLHASSSLFSWKTCIIILSQLKMMLQYCHNLYTLYWFWQD